MGIIILTGRNMDNMLSRDNCTKGCPFGHFTLDECLANCGRWDGKNILDTNGQFPR